MRSSICSLYLVGSREKSHLNIMIVELRKCCKLEESWGAVAACKRATSPRAGMGVGLGMLNLEGSRDSP